MEQGAGVKYSAALTVTMRERGRRKALGKHASFLFSSRTKETWTPSNESIEQA